MFNLPQPNVFFIYSKTFTSSLCKEILNTNSKPETSSFAFFLILIKKLDSASQRPTNHSKNLVFKGDSGNSLLTPVNNALILLYSPAKQVPAAQRWPESKSLTLDLKKINTK